MKATKKRNEDRAKDQALSQIESILELVKRLKHIQDCNDSDCQEGKDGGDYWDDSESYHNEESSQQSIQEDPLDIQLRSGWYSPDNEQIKAEEYNILLCTGGPACRIIGSLNEYQRPNTARIEYQDWFKAWEEYLMTSEQAEAVLFYAQQFYFGE